MEIPKKAWNNYVKQLSLVNKAAADYIEQYVIKNGIEKPKDLVDYAYYVVRKYGNGSASLSAAMYDALAMIEGANVPSAELADLPEYDEVAKSIFGTLKTSSNPKEIAGAASRLVKRTGADTMLINAQRDGAQFAWIPSGDTCAFCITLASRGWQYMSKSALKNGHAEHIHSNCDCTYAVRFDETTSVPGYKPEVYREMYDNAEGNNPKEKINAMRRKFYAENKSIVGTESDKAEELIRSISDYEKSIMNNPTESAKLYKKDGSVVDFGGVDHAVIGDASVLNEMEGGILTHNHPTDVTFSNNDIANGIVKGNLAELRAITRNGNLHQLINENVSIDDRRKFFVQFNERIKKYTNIAHDKIRRGERINQQEYVNSRLEQWLLENAPQYHLRYIKTKV